MTRGIQQLQSPNLQYSGPHLDTISRHLRFPGARALGHIRSSTGAHAASWGYLRSVMARNERRSRSQAEGVLAALSSLQASAMAARFEEPSTCAVQLDAATLACMLAAVHTSHQLHLLSSVVAQQYHAAAAAETHDTQASAGNAGEPSLGQLAEQGSLKGLSEPDMRASPVPATAELAAAISQTSDTEQKPVSAAPAGKDPSASSSGFLGQHAALPATAEVQDCKAQGSLKVLLAADLKIADSLKSAEATLAHFHAIIEGDPQLAGQVGNEQIKMRAVLQVLQAKRHELLGISEAFQEGEHLDALPTSAISCLAEAEAFLLVANFTIKEARSRVLYSQAWPGQHGKPA